MRTRRRYVAACLLLSLCYCAPSGAAGIPAELKKIYAPAALERGGILIDAPQAAENPQNVPVRVRRLPDLPPAAEIKEVSIYIAGHWDKPVARFYFTTLNPMTMLTLRLRLPGASTLYAVARLADGRALVDRTDVKVTVGGCGGGGAPHVGGAPGVVPMFLVPALPVDREQYAVVDRNGVIRTSDTPVSTFSVDVDTAAYSNVRRFLLQGTLPPSAAVRLEEMVNYFPYDFRWRDQPHPFAVEMEVAQTPWNPHTKLIRIALAARELETSHLPPANLVFLVDVSGSMQPPNKLPLLKSALRLLVQAMRPQDRIAIAVYAGAAGVVLETTSGADKGRILAALERLEAGGSTNGGQGIKLAYALARQSFIPDGINRVLLATDGDFNVGVVSHDALLDIVKRERESGIALTTLGLGMGNYNDKLLERIADAGDGNHAYIDSLREARKVLISQLAGTLYTIAHDAKVQVMFNPVTVAEYRLLGYENRLLKREDFSNDKVDAGDIGAGHRVTALYEISLTGSKGQRVEPSPYEAPPGAGARADELATVRLRYKKAANQPSTLIEHTLRTRDIRPSVREASADWRFASAVAAFAQLLRGEPYLERFGYKETARLARGAVGADGEGYRREFIELVELAERLAPARPEERVRAP